MSPEVTLPAPLFAAQTQPLPATDGDPIAVFERELSPWVDGREVVACDTPATALELAIRAAGARGQEVVVPSLGAAGAASALLAAGCRVVPAEVEQHTATLSTRGLAVALSGETRAVVVAHTRGHPASMPELLRLIEHHGLTLIEDASGALGASYAGRAAGTFGAVAAIGFREGSTVTAGGAGGAVVLQDAERAGRVRGWRDEHDAAPSETSARIALSELRGLEETLLRRRQAAWHLSYELRRERGLAAMYHGRRVRHGFDRYVFRIRPALWERSLEETVAALQSAGLPGEVATGPPLHEDDAVCEALPAGDERLVADRFEVASRLSNELIAVALSAQAITPQLSAVADAIRALAPGEAA